MELRSLLPLLLLFGAGLMTLPFKPWTMLHRPPLCNPWLAALMVLPWVWSTAAHLPGALPVQLSFASLTVLMFGWPLAVWTWLGAAVAAAWLAQPTVLGHPLAWLLQASTIALWNGLVPGTIALLAGLATRRWLPHHLMVYILARGFGATLLGMSPTGVLWVYTHPLPAGNDSGTLLLGRWLIAWGDAVATGMLTSIFVAFHPQWLATRPTPIAATCRRAERNRTT